MADLTIAKKKELAQVLFTRNNLTQKEVARKVGISEVTMSKWVNAEGWDKLKLSLTVTREEQLQRLYLQIAEVNSNIEQRPAGQRFANSKEADTINKLASTIEKLEKETGAVEILEVSKKMLDWLRKFDLSKAQELADLFGAFLKDSIK